MNHPLVHVLVINWNGLRHLQECFTTLLQSTYANARFILLDNGSTDTSTAFVTEKFGHDDRVDILRIEENRGWSGANNIGIERALDANADYILLLNNDTATEPDCIAHLVTHAEGDREIGALAPKLLLHDAPELINSIGLEASRIGAAWDRGLGRLDGPRWNETEPVIGVCGAAFFIRSEALRKSGLLPEDFEIYLDDYDLSLRIRSAGYKIETCPAARVRHKFSATMGTGNLAARKTYLNTRNRFRVIERNFPRNRLGEVLAAVAKAECRAVGRALLDANPRGVWAHKRAWLSALAYVPGAAGFRREHPPAADEWWSLLRSDRTFFPGVELPENGWYHSIPFDGIRVQPISKFAHYLHEAGKLKVTAVHPHPNLGPINVTILANGEPIARFNTTDRQEQTLDIPRSELVFKSEKIFEAEQTNHNFDTGGWFALEPM